MNPNINKVIDVLLNKNKFENAHDIIASSMEILDTFNGLTGGLKSKSVYDVVNELINNNPLNLDLNIINDLHFIINNGLLQKTIDVIYKASSGLYDISYRKPPTFTMYYSYNSGPHILAMKTMSYNTKN
jgi:hypothetical protein